MKNKKNKLTTASGKPYVENENTMSVGARGPLLLQDFILHEKMAHFNRERIPERVVHAKGAGAFGTFSVTNDISKYTKAKMFNKVGKETTIPIGAIITIEERKNLGSLTMKIAGEVFVGNESRLLHKVRLP